MKKINIPIAILAIAGLLIFAMTKGYDGALLTSGIALIAGIVGYSAHKKVKP